MSGPPAGTERFVVPSLPPLDDAALLQHELVHAALDERMGGVRPAVAVAFVRLSTRLLVESLANLRPVLVDAERPLLVPPPRRFLSHDQRARLGGARAAFRHVDCRIAMLRAGQVPTIVEPSTPEVLNGLLQPEPGTRRETNAGMVRATPTNWKVEANPFEHPPPSECRSLLAGAVEMVANAPAPPIARAGWLAFTVMTVHPFVDANGRTARALALAVASAGVPSGVDWGLLEQWSLARDAYVVALQAGQRAPSFAAAAVDPRPFMSFTVASSTRGVEVSIARLDLLADLADELDRRTGDPAGTSLVVQALVDRFVGLDVLEEILRAVPDQHDDPSSSPARSLPPHTIDVVERLVRSGLLRWARVPIGVHPAASRDGGLAPGDRVDDLARVLAEFRFGDQLVTS